MRVIAFLGSPRKDGNTSILLKEATRGVEEAGHPVKLFKLPQLKIRGCLNCGGCEEAGECIIVDDQMPKVYAAIREATASSSPARSSSRASRRRPRR